MSLVRDGSARCSVSVRHALAVPNAAPAPDVVPATSALSAPSSSAAPSAVSSASLAAPEPELVVADPVTLARLSDSGFTAGAALVGACASSMAQIASHPAFRPLYRSVEADLAADRRADPAAGVGMRYAHRQFDVRWLASENTRLDLIAVVNRLDRRPFAPEHCGEIRFVYRLAYRVDTATGVVDSRLPMTVNVVYYDEPNAAGACTDAARAWLRPQEAKEPVAESAWLVSEHGPLSASRHARWKLKSVELNYQSVRWPATVRPAMGGHAEYVLRVFHATAGAPYFEPAPLENTVDVPRLAQHPALRDELLAWIRTPEALRGIDAGVVRVPDRFLAERVVSVSPHGLARLANRPFSAVIRAFGPGFLGSLRL